MKIVIERLTDEHDCETCGSSYAEGARVYFNDELALSLEPSAYCYDSTDYDDSQILVQILEKLGHAVQYEQEF